MSFMPKQIYLSTFLDERKAFSVFEMIIPILKKSVFDIYYVKNSVVGVHRNYKTIQAAIYIFGAFKIILYNCISESVYLLDSINKCIVLASEDFLIENSIQTEIHYPLDTHNQQGYQKMLNGSYPFSGYLYAHLLSLFIFFAHSEEEILFVSDIINPFKP